MCPCASINIYKDVQNSNFPNRPKLKKLKCLSPIERRETLQRKIIQIMQKNRLQLHATMWIKLINSTLSHRSLDIKDICVGTSLVVQWLRLRAPNAGARVRSLVWELDPTCMPQLRVCMPQLRSRCNQINK